VLVDFRVKPEAQVAEAQVIAQVLALESVDKEITVALDYFKAVRTQVEVEVDGVQLVATQQPIKVARAAQELVLHIVALVLPTQVVVAVGLSKVALAQGVAVAVAPVLIGTLDQTEHRTPVEVAEVAEVADHRILVAVEAVVVVL
jgi:hypothetical protein